jgi:hypothetical protein
MNPIRKNILKREIAEILSQCEPHLVKDRITLAQLNMTCQPPATDIEFEEVMRDMSTRQQIIRPRDDDNELTAKLTALGRAEILKAS